MIPKMEELSAINEAEARLMAGKGSPKEFVEKYIQGVAKGLDEWLMDNPPDPIKTYEWKDDLHPDPAENEAMNLEDQAEHYENEVRNLRSSTESAIHLFSISMTRLNRDVSFFEGNPEGKPRPNPQDPPELDAVPENPYGEEVGKGDTEPYEDEPSEEALKQAEDKKAALEKDDPPAEPSKEAEKLLAEKKKQKAEQEKLDSEQEEIPPGE